MKSKSKSRKSFANSKKRGTNSLEIKYNRFFVACPSPLWASDDDQFSLEQPSPLQRIESETTYGIGHLQQQVCNA